MTGLDRFRLKRFYTLLPISCEIPQKSLNGESVRGNSSDHKQRSRVCPNTHLSLRHDTEQALARDQGTQPAISTSQFLKPLAFVMCLGCEPGQPGKRSNNKLQILFSFHSVTTTDSPQGRLAGTEKAVSQFGSQRAN